MYVCVHMYVSICVCVATDPAFLVLRSCMLQAKLCYTYIHVCTCLYYQTNPYVCLFVCRYARLLTILNNLYAFLPLLCIFTKSLSLLHVRVCVCTPAICALLQRLLPVLPIFVRAALLHMQCDHEFSTIQLRILLPHILIRQWQRQVNDPHAEMHFQACRKE